jgi:hypothetical protein
VAILAVDEVMLREPRLLVPRMQPVGLVKVDWFNPLAQGLSFVWLGSVPYVDLAQGRVRAGNGNTGNTITPIGVGRYASAAGEAGDNFGNVQAITSNTFTVLSHAAPIASASPKSLFSQRRGTSPYEEIGMMANWAISAGSGYLEVYASDVVNSGNRSNAYTANTAVDGKPHVFVGVNGGSYTATQIFVDGINKTIGTGSGATNNVFSTNQNTRVNNLAALASTGYTNPDPNYLVMTWSGRALSAAEVRSISADPYQFLIPA